MKNLDAGNVGVVVVLFQGAGEVLMSGGEGYENRGVGKDTFVLVGRDDGAINVISRNRTHIV